MRPFTLLARTLDLLTTRAPTRWRRTLPESRAAGNGASADAAGDDEAQAALRESEHRLHLATSAARIGHFEIDWIARRREWSPELRALLAVPPGLDVERDEGLIGRIIGPQHAERYRANLTASLDPHGSGEFEDEHEVTRLDGTKAWMLIRGRTFFEPGPDGLRPVRTVGLMMDVSERHAAEARYRALSERLQHEQELLQRIIDAIPVMITLYLPDTRVLRLNPEFERVTGWSTADVQHLDLMECCYPDPAYREQVREFMQSLQPGWREFTITTRDGRTVETAWANVRLPNDTQVGIGLDITERRALEQTQRDFLANVSHELRNPLASIRGYAQLMQRRASYSDRAVDTIISQTGALERLIGDLLEVSRLEGGSLELRPGELDLVEVTRTSADEAQATTDEHTLRVEGPAGPLMGTWDADRLRQVFRNLLSNAIKYSPDGGEIVVRIEDREREATISIRDPGLGIPPDQLSRLFDRFYRAGASAGVTGLGLGLYITRELVEAHGGRIWAESAGVDQGSTFSFTLPVEAPTPTPSPAAAGEGRKGEAADEPAARSYSDDLRPAGC